MTKVNELYNTKQGMDYMSQFGIIQSGSQRTNTRYIQNRQEGVTANENMNMNIGKHQNGSKRTNECNQKRGKESTHRAGDWICNLCNNHNYSFREVCNSCKVQTKISNLKESLEMCSQVPNSCQTQIPGQIQPRKKLNVKSGYQYEMMLKLKDSWTAPLSPSYVPYHPEITHRAVVTRLLEDSFAEFPFEKEFVLHQKCQNYEDDSSEEVTNESDSVELERQTLKLLAFD